jgi:hypothetical protein
LTRFFEESIVITPWERPDHKEVFMYSGAVLPAILALEAVILLTLWVFLYQLMKQQGRLLLRLDGLQRQVTDSQIAALTGSNAAAAAAPTGLSPGTAVTPFSLPDLAGQRELQGQTSVVSPLESRMRLLREDCPRAGRVAA